MKAALLPDRAAVRVEGPEARGFLQGLVTSDMDEVGPGRARHAALLTPQGKILFEFMVAESGPDSVLLDVARDKASELAKRLGFYKLRARVEIREAGDLGIAAGWDGAPQGPGTVFPDPRLAALGFRVIAPAEALEAWLGSPAVEAVEAAAYDAHRISLGVPEGGRDFPLGDSFPHEADMDQLGGVDFDKGCFVGQEVVSRMQHRGTARRRVVPVLIEGPAPAPGTEVTAGGRAVGVMGSAMVGRGLAMLRLDRVADAPGEPLQAGGARLRVLRPGWARFDVPGADSAVA
jgi:folate-binding protein YgfZ